MDGGGEPAAGQASGGGERGASAAFDPARPLDGRMWWAAHAHLGIFRTPSLTPTPATTPTPPVPEGASAPTAEAAARADAGADGEAGAGAGAGAGARGEGHRRDHPNHSNRPHRPVATWHAPPNLVEELAETVMAPWRSTGITRADVETALASDSSCTLLSYIEGTLHVYRPCSEEGGCEVGEEGEGGSQAACGDGGDDDDVDGGGDGGSGGAGNDDGRRGTCRSATDFEAEGGNAFNGLPSPTGYEQEPWWRVRRRAAMIEVVQEVITERELAGAPLPSGLELVVCTADCVMTGAHQDRHAWRLPEIVNSTASAPAFTIVGCAGSDNLPFPVFMNRSDEVSHPVYQHLYQIGIIFFTKFKYWSSALSLSCRY